MTGVNNLNQQFNSMPSKIWAVIAHIDELKGRWIGGAQLSPQVLGRLKKSVLVTSTGASTRIEGAKLSDEQVEKLMKGIIIQKFADRDKQEVKGYYELLQNVFDSWRHIKFSENTIKHFHQELLKYVEKDKLHRGEYKKRENKVQMIDHEGNPVGILFDTTPAYLTDKEMQELCELTANALQEGVQHPLLIIGKFVVEFLLIHPFQDGNGRLSRVLTNLLLLHAGYAFMPYVSHEKLIEEHKIDYYLALRKTQNTLRSESSDFVPWFDFFLSMISQQAQTAVDLLSEENIEKLLSPKQLSVWQYFQKVDEATPKEIAQTTGVARPTINQILDRLMTLKKIERIGLGRTTRYRKI
ncbi:MAG: Fic family protein [Candidatus Auribacterota bacterium]